VREEWDEALELEEVRRDKDGMSDVDAAKEDWEEEVITDFVRRKRPDEACFKFDISRTIGKHVVHGDYLNHPVLVLV
jgi:hypothetical protein